MSSANFYRRKVGVNLTQGVGNRVIDFLRERHPRKTAENIEAETGIAAKTVAKWLEGVCLPGFPAVLTLTSAYGPEFLCAVMDNPPRWLSEAARLEKAAQVERQIAALQADLARLR